MKSGIDPAAIRKGLQAGEFFLEYQPIVALKDGRCQGAEALIRWRRGTEVVPPMQFIPAAERTPLSGLITLWIVERLAEEMAPWLARHPEAFLAINVPPEILGRGGLEHAAKKSGLYQYVSQIVLEITERGVPDEIGVGAMAAMPKTGLRIALDDMTFAGGPNLAALLRSQFAFLKLDRALIEEIRPGSPFPGWLKSLRAFLEAGPAAAIAEGVETKVQADALRDAHVSSAQGFYFSKPLPADAFFEYYRRSRPG